MQFNREIQYSMSVCAGDGTCRGTRAKKSRFKKFQLLYRNYKSLGLNRSLFFLLILQVVLEMKPWSYSHPPVLMTNLSEQLFINSSFLSHAMSSPWLR